MASTSLPSVHSSNVSSAPSIAPLAGPSFYMSSSSSSCSSLSIRPSSLRPTRLRSSSIFADSRSRRIPKLKVNCAAGEPLKVMISGAPASGKGTQCELIVQKFGLVHISTGDILRAEISAGSEIGNKAKEFMNSGRLVPDEIVTTMVTTRLSCEDATEKGWLLDGYPRTLSQAESLQRLQIKPDVYLILDALSYKLTVNLLLIAQGVGSVLSKFKFLLHQYISEVPDEILIDRCIGRRLDPETGKIYHLKYFPPETEEIKGRLVTRPDDTEEKVKQRLEIYKRNAEAIAPVYLNITKKIDGSRSKEEIFEEISSVLSQMQKEKATKFGKSTLGFKSTSGQDSWRGIPTRLNNIPHSREIRKYFYDDVLEATKRAVKDGRTRLKVEINIPELNPEMDVYRIGTLMELVRTIALSFADDGRRVKVCIQGSMGEGALSGMPLQLAGTRRILEYMDWGDYGAFGTFVKIGSIGAKEVDEQDDMFVLVAPQNAVGNCIIDDMKAMTDAAADRPVILVNPRLKDLPGSSGIMQTMGRDKRLEYAASFQICYFFRLLYYAGTQYPIMGALRMSHPYGYELYKRVDESSGKERYVMLSKFPSRPSTDDINNAFQGKQRNEVKKSSGIWGFLSGIF
ncbi:adenylate kinase 5, chloroplastic isoform X2 [Momordica charantia]|uniref:adenylate kinase n=1 Tax=Momordica charantia TaxID=3673 RepID=A0A6J1CNS3_MOMCH|nr:adenylate kinase 5, chloroplastic isoform X2 [Momordica charantia]